MRAVILAGGHSERFGSPKAFAKINGDILPKANTNVEEYGML